MGSSGLINIPQFVGLFVKVFGCPEFKSDLEFFFGRVSLTDEPTRPFTMYYKREPVANRATATVQLKTKANRVASTAKLQ